MTHTYTHDEIAARGKALYEQTIRAQVEPAHVGSLLLVDIETGAWQVGDDRIPLSRALRALNPNAVLFGLRVGYPSAEKIGAWPASAPDGESAP